jgi:hypothetical protein
MRETGRHIVDTRADANRVRESTVADTRRHPLTVIKGYV